MQQEKYEYSRTGKFRGRDPGQVRVRMKGGREPALHLRGHGVRLMTPFIRAAWPGKLQKKE